MEQSAWMADACAYIPLPRTRLDADLSEGLTLPFSVVIPLHNKESTILRAVESVLRQTEQPDALIVVDDGSTDSGVEQLSRSEFWQSISLVRQRQSGPGPARNAGWARCASEWVAFLDADDVWAPDHLAVLRRLIKEFPDVEWVSSASKLVMNRAVLRPADFAHFRWPVHAVRHRTVGTRASYFDLARKRVVLPNSSSTAVRRQALQAVGGFADVLPNEDLALWCALALRGDVGYSAAQTAQIHKGVANITDDLRERDSRRYCEDAFALAASPHFVRVATALERAQLDPRLRVSAERYLDHLLLRHWPTVIVQETQSCARQALVLARRRWHWRYLLFAVAAYLPKRAASFLAVIGNRLLRSLRIAVPVSPFIHRQL